MQLGLHEAVHAGFRATIADLNKAATRLQHSVGHDNTFQVMLCSLDMWICDKAWRCWDGLGWRAGLAGAWEGGWEIETSSVIGRHASSGDYICVSTSYMYAHTCMTLCTPCISHRAFGSCMRMREAHLLISVNISLMLSEAWSPHAIASRVPLSRTEPKESLEYSGILLHPSHARVSPTLEDRACDCIPLKVLFSSLPGPD